VRDRNRFHHFKDRMCSCKDTGDLTFEWSCAFQVFFLFLEFINRSI